MLIYHPVHDINHCIYRTLRCLEISDRENFTWEQMRLLDFYSLFPHLLKKIAPFPVELRAYRAIVNRIPDPYESMPNQGRVFHEIMPIQNTAIHNLVAKNLINANLFKRQVVSRTAEELPSGLSATLSNDPVPQEEWYRFLVNQLPGVNFLGSGGLKARSDLLEYRYDG
ncbi:MAG: ABC-three component system middle component 5 [Congregibacter sp.]